mmetsp:Transcript_7114/g.21343  ORF Transcript_7114/g.21343 Transcript_7114/m.21343 type:complete len:324 (-) Transcript_7114:178-1149(-)
MCRATHRPRVSDARGVLRDLGFEHSLRLVPLFDVSRDVSHQVIVQKLVQLDVRLVHEFFCNPLHRAPNEVLRVDEARQVADVVRGQPALSVDGRGELHEWVHPVELGHGRLLVHILLRQNLIEGGLLGALGRLLPMPPPRDAQSWLVRHNNLFNVVKALPGKHREHGHRVPGGQDSLHRMEVRQGKLLLLVVGVTNAVVQGQSPPVLALPLPLRVGEVQNVGHLSGANDVVVAEQVPPLGINIAGAIRLVNELSAARDALHEAPELLRVKHVSQPLQLRELPKRVLVEPIEICEVPRLQDLVDVGFLEGRLQVGDDLLSHASQ